MLCAHAIGHEVHVIPHNLFHSTQFLSFHTEVTEVNSHHHFSFTGVKTGKKQVARSAALVRRALSWALDLDDPGAFETRGIVMVHRRKGTYTSADDHKKELDAGTQVMVEVEWI